MLLLVTANAQIVKPCHLLFRRLTVVTQKKTAAIFSSEHPATVFKWFGRCSDLASIRTGSLEG